MDRIGLIMYLPTCAKILLLITPCFLECFIFRGGILFLVSQKIPRLTVKGFTKLVKRREPDGPGMPLLENGKVGDCNPNPVRQLGERYFPLNQNQIQIDFDSHNSPFR